jgi:hypothetical protein
MTIAYDFRIPVETAFVRFRAIASIPRVDFVVAEMSMGRLVAKRWNSGVSLLSCLLFLVPLSSPYLQYRVRSALHGRSWMAWARLLAALETFWSIGHFLCFGLWVKSPGTHYSPTVSRKANLTLHGAFFVAGRLHYGPAITP